MFTASGLSKWNAHELVNPTISPLGAFPGALELPNPRHCDARSGQTVEDPFICQRWQSQQEEREKCFWSDQHPPASSSWELLHPATAETLWALELNTMPYLAVMYVFSHSQPPD